MKRLLTVVCVLALMASSGCVQNNYPNTTVKAKEKSGDGVRVTKENYASVMVDFAMNREFKVGANNTSWHHHRKPMELDKQPAPMMNKIPCIPSLSLMVEVMSLLPCQRPMGDISHCSFGAMTI